MLGDRLRELRISSGLTQLQVADKIGIARVNYTQYELGKREPDFERLCDFARFFKVSTDYLLGHETSPVDEGDEGDEVSDVNPMTGDKVTGREKQQLKTLLDDARTLFFDKTISERDKKTVKQAIEEAFWQAKSANRRK